MLPESSEDLDPEMGPNGEEWAPNRASGDLPPVISASFEHLYETLSTLIASTPFWTCWMSLCTQKSAEASKRAGPVQQPVSPLYHQMLTFFWSSLIRGSLLKLSNFKPGSYMPTLTVLLDRRCDCFRTQILPFVTPVSWTLIWC